MKTLLNKRAVLLSFLLSVFFISVAYAQSMLEIAFPVGELGNCGSKKECKAYCDEEKNISSCRAFARTNNLENNNDEKNFEKVTENGGPGGCAVSSKDPIISCEKYCDDTVNIKECVLYAKTHGLMDSHELAEAEKVLAALDRGARLPSGCTNKKTCQSICEAPSNTRIARECFDFAEEAGLLPPEVSREQAEKVFKAIEEGRAPFKSPKDFEQCENPSSDEIMEKCINFALKNDFLSGEEAEMVKKTGGKGPGGCRGRECKEFCKNPDNSEVCYNFANEYGLMDPEMEKGSQDFLESLRNAPPAVKTCLQAEFGGNLDKVFPGPENGAKLRNCYETYGRNEGTMQGEIGNAFPPEIKSCILSQIGEEGFKQLTEKGPTPQMDEKMRKCFEIRTDSGGGNESRMEERTGEEFRPYKDIRREGVPGENIYREGSEQYPQYPTENRFEGQEEIPTMLIPEGIHQEAPTSFRLERNENNLLSNVIQALGSLLR